MKLRTTFLAAAALLAAVTSTAAEAAGRRLLVVNAASQSIWYLYSANAGQRYWDDVDLLGGDVIIEGESEPINFDDGSGYCIFNLKAVMRDGTEVVRNGVNVCTSVAWGIGDDMNIVR